MLAAHDKQAAIILAIPAGGVPVGVVIAEKTGLDFDVAVASAYQHWSDVAEKDVVKILEQFKTRDL
jgi:predicted phosphoribosyltransferase